MPIKLNKSEWLPYLLNGFTESNHNMFLDLIKSLEKEWAEYNYIDNLTKQLIFESYIELNSFMTRYFKHFYKDITLVILEKLSQF